MLYQKEIKSLHERGDEERNSLARLLFYFPTLGHFYYGGGGGAV